MFEVLAKRTQQNATLCHAMPCYAMLCYRSALVKLVGSRNVIFVCSATLHTEDILYIFIFLFFPIPARFGHDAKIVHFTGAVKPWSAGKSREDSQSHLMEQFVSLWWKEYLSYPTSAPPEKQLHPRSPSPQKVLMHNSSVSPRLVEWSERLGGKLIFAWKVLSSSSDAHHSPSFSQSREQEDKMPFTESFDDSTSLLAHFSRPPDSLRVSSEVDTVRKQTSKYK